MKAMTTINTMKTRRPPPLRLTNPTTARPQCAACGKQVKDMSRHGGTAACANAARKALIARLGHVEVMWRDAAVLTRGSVPVVVVRDQSSWKGRKQDRRRWYADPKPVTALHSLLAAGVEEKRIARLLSGPKEELERELTLAALAGDSLHLPPGWRRGTP